MHHLKSQTLKKFNNPISTSLIQPGGSLILTTINRTPQSYLLAILGAEYVLNIVERGTHDWNKFVPDDELASLVIYSKCVNYSHYSIHLFVEGNTIRSSSLIFFSERGLLYGLHIYS